MRRTGSFLATAGSPGFQSTRQEAPPDQARAVGKRRSGRRAIFSSCLLPPRGGAQDWHRGSTGSAQGDSIHPWSRLRGLWGKAPARSCGGPQTPSPVIRIAPKPRRLTVSLPPSETVPLAAAGRLIAFSDLVFMCSLLSIIAL